MTEGSPPPPIAPILDPMAPILDPTDENLERAAEALRRGELIGLPTETVYGLAADATNATAVKRIFEAKGRPPNNPLIVHVAGFDQLSQVIAWPPDEITRRQLEVTREFWPGGVTVVCRRAATIPEIVTAGRDTVAVRIPDHPVALELLRRCPFPLAAPSANPSNYVSPTSPEHVRDGLGRQVALILDGGPCDRGLESTILALGRPQPAVLRVGAVSLESLSARFGVELSEGSGTQDTVAALPAPGMLPVHYAPRTPLTVLDQPFPEWLPRDVRDAGAAEKPLPWGRIAFAPISESERSWFRDVEVLSKSADPSEVARGLFAAMRALDRRGLQRIFVDRCDETGIGRAIMDRLRRAAARGSAPDDSCSAAADLSAGRESRNPPRTAAGGQSQGNSAKV